MGTVSREELDEQAVAAGLDPTDYATKEDLQTALDDHASAQAALGPVVPPGVSEATFKPQASPNTGIQPLTDDDLPDGLR